MISLFINPRYRLHCAANQWICHGIGMKIYILQTQDQRTLNKDLEWSSEADRNIVFCTPFRDIALNQLIELNAKDIDLRASIVECDTDAKGGPVLTADLQASNQSAANSAQSDAA